MSVKLIYSSPIWLIANAIRYSHDNHHLSDTDNIRDFHGLDLTENPDFNDIGIKDFDLIKRVGFKMKHESVLEHSLIVFEFEASRALLQELSRSRIGISPTVKSTRYVLKKDLKNEEPFLGNISNFERAKKYVYFTNNDKVNRAILLALENVRALVYEGYSNDIVKYAIPEAMLFKGQYSFNLRSLVNLLNLRTNKDVLPEFQQLCKDIIDSLPDDYKELVLTNEKIRTNYEWIKNGK